MSKERVIHAVQSQLAMEDAARAERIATTVTGLLCRRLDRGEVENLKELSNDFDSCTLVRGTLPEKIESETFFDTVGSECELDFDQTVEVMRATFRAIKEDLPPEEIDGVAGQLPLKLKVLWLEA